MLKREWGAENNGNLPHLFIPSKTATLVPELAVKGLPLGRTLWWLWWWFLLNQLNFLLNNRLYFLPLFPDIWTSQRFQRINFNYYIMIFYYILLARYTVFIYLVFSVFTSKAMSLLTFMIISVFFLTVSKFAPNILTSSWTRTWCFPFSSPTYLFSWTVHGYTLEAIKISIVAANFILHFDLYEWFIALWLVLWWYLKIKYCSIWECFVLTRARSFNISFTLHYTTLYYIIIILIILYYIFFCFLL